VNEKRKKRGKKGGSKQKRGEKGRCPVADSQGGKRKRKKASIRNHAMENIGTKRKLLRGEGERGKGEEGFCISNTGMVGKRAEEGKEKKGAGREDGGRPVYPKQKGKKRGGGKLRRPFYDWHHDRREKESQEEKEGKERCFQWSRNP